MLDERKIASIFAGLEEVQSSLLDKETIRQRHKNMFTSIVKEFISDLGYAEVRKIVGDCLD